MHPDGPPKLTPILDSVLGHGHLVHIETEPSRRTAPHTHDCDQVFFVTSGVAIFESRSGTIAAAVGDVIVVPAGEPHVHATGGDTGTTYVYLTSSGHSTDVVEPR